MRHVDAPPPKYQQVLQALQREIGSGHLKGGDRLPSEAELERTFKASRITVSRALRELQLAGMVERRVGSGTYVRSPARDGSSSFGVLIPDLGETEIFEPMLHAMMSSPLARQRALLWASAPAGTRSKEEVAWDLCQQYIGRTVAGVFFAPLELTEQSHEVNHRIVRALDAAKIPIVLLDRTVQPYPHRGRHDLVGLDNRRAGYLVTEHLAGLGCRRIAFASVPYAAATVDARAAGYREALYQAGVPVDQALVQRLDPEDAAAVRSLMAVAPDAVVCANDRTAGRLMHTLLGLGHRVPDDVRLVGIDDVAYARLLPVPLTTLRQPSREIGIAAIAAMLDRLAHPDLPTRDILLQGTLIVRKSCGASHAT
jgi:GntR family transcriptional regulator of arabinose operon